ncbi:MAG: SMP-30/gluconolactonase/LRE family protein [Massilia sp.]
MSLFAPACLWDVGAELGEGALWHAASGRVYFVDIKGSKIHRCAPDGSARRSWDTPHTPGFLLPVADGGFVCGMRGGLYRFDEQAGSFSLLHAVERDQPTNRLNDGYVDAGGALWFGSMDDLEESATGVLYRLGESGDARAMEREYIITNGPAMSPDGRTLYHADTLRKQVYAFDVMRNGRLERKRVFATITGGAYPDGMAVDSDGDVWLALFNGGRIERYNASGKLLASVALPCSNVTKLAFGGDDLRTVFVTTAWKGMSAAQRASEPLAGGLFTFRTDTPGQQQHAFSIGALLEQH